MNLPNQLSLLRIFLTPVFVFLFFLDHRGYQIAAFAVFTIASITDWYDGYVARKLGEESLVGQFLDPLADKILVSSGLICFSVTGLVPAWMVLVIVVRDLLLTALRSYAILKGIPFKTNFFAKAKTTGQVIVIYFIFLFHLFAWNQPEPLPLILQKLKDWQISLVFMGLITGITVISGLIYLATNPPLLRRIAADIRRVMATILSV
ncbi:MAG TPA: CDP-diacylglycerol--glycerol-3-phosphate 3-phosphatidyltransferase [bacterium]|nr:CDP-diacylglycerol--glycerol-3-phosphate 3-phosphatidyltransferase [bacterium]